MILVTEDLVVFSKIFVLVRRAGEKARPGIVCAVGQRNVLADDVCPRRVQNARWDTTHLGSLTVGGAIGPIHLCLGAGQIRDHLRLRKVALPLEGGRNHTSAQELANRLPQSGIAEEEEGSVMLHWAADRTAKLVAVVGRIQGCIPWSRIEISIAHEFEQRTMKLIASGARYGRHHGTGHAAILRREVAGFYAKLLQRVRVGERVSIITNAGHIASAIQEEADHGNAAVNPSIDDDLCG